MIEDNKNTDKFEKWKENYIRDFPLYENYTKNLKELIIKLLGENGIYCAQIESRTKSVDSFIKKVKDSQASYEDPCKEITDLAGIRIIMYYNEEIDKVCEIIKGEFCIDEKNSVDKAKIMDPDRFGYLSIHYIVSLSEKRKGLSEWKSYAALKAEIQIRTILQHAWASIDHVLRYKSPNEVPTPLKRKLYCLSALLELADTEFSNIRRITQDTDKKYFREVKRGDLDIELNLSSLLVFLESKKEHIKWEATARKLGYRKSPPVEKRPYGHVHTEERTLLSIALALKISSIRELDQILSSASQWGELALKKIFILSKQYGFTPYAIGFDMLSLLLYYSKRREPNTIKVVEKIGYYYPAIKKALKNVLSEDSRK